MYCKLVLRTVIMFTVAMGLFCPKSAKSQNNFEKALALKMDSFLSSTATYKATNELYPNDAMQSVMTPTGWGGYGTCIFGGIGGVYPEVYKSNKPDLITSAGACTGNPIKAVNVAVSVNMTNVHKLRDFSTNFVISRKIGKGSSISIGGLQLFANHHQSDAAASTFYVAVSHVVQTIYAKTPGSSKLAYTIGIGSGRFLRKSVYDIKEGKGKYGTAVFGSISYAVVRHVNLNAEWSGMNLGFSVGIRPFKNALSIGLGACNLTRYSADKPNMVFFIGYPLLINR